MPRIFISYRRDDAGYVAAVLNEKIQSRFGPDSVFLDVDHIPLGVDFREHINQAVSQCDILLAIIGDQWLDARNERGGRRIEDPADYARIEIEAALKRNIPTIPILIDRAVIPPADALPESLRSLAFRNAAELRAGRDFHTHADRLIEGLVALLAPKQSAPSPPPPQGTRPAQKPTAEPSAPARQPAPEGTTVFLLDDLRPLLGGFTDANVFVGGAIPSMKATNAIAAYAHWIVPEDILLLYDNTVFGGARDGLLLTGTALFWHNMGEQPGRRSYTEIHGITCEHKSLVSHLVFDVATIQVNCGQRRDIAEVLTKVVNAFAERSRGG
jgi:hypothetical protein